MAGSAVETHRVIIERVRPAVECGRFAAKAAIGQPVEVSADVFADGHDTVMALVRHGPVRRGRTAAWREEVWLQPAGNDRFVGLVVPVAIGPWGFEVIGLPDDYGTWARDLRIRFEAGQELDLEIEEGALMVERRLAAAKLAAGPRRDLERLLGSLRARGGVGAIVDVATDPGAVDLARRTADRSRASVAGPFSLWVDRELGTFSAWYEMFPRSEGARPPAAGVPTDSRRQGAESAGWQSGTFVTAAKRLPAIAAMGF